MTDETSKTRTLRGKEFEERYLRGRVIDIGCGPDPIVPHAEPFDIEHGDAQDIANLRPRESYDAVCSSHCLEHMRDVPGALRQWWELVRPGGFLILVVPDEDLYEQGGWPSLFNLDHKATFRFEKNDSWSPVSHDILQLVKQLDGAEVLSYERQDQGYDHSLRRLRLSKLDRIMFRTNQIRQGAFRRLAISGTVFDRLAEKFFVLLGKPVDQTTGAALAQIQIVARKLSYRKEDRDLIA